MTVRVLDNEIVNLIAAGEVVERPASIVKELLENSLDAGASRITVEIREGGSKLIKIIDNGCGMSRQDAKNSILRHATSKIGAKEDLDSISTLGFRGEALSSIAAVSKLRIRTGDGKEGTEVFSDGTIKEAPSSKGTVVEASELFYNTPARKKHLATMRTEQSRISDVVISYALINYNMHIELVVDGKKTIVAPACDNLIDNIASIWGSSTAVNLSKMPDPFIGAVSKAHFQRPSRTLQQLYVNGRAVKSKILSDAIYRAYHTFLNVGMHPVYVIDISIDTSKTDVNIHPRKEEIRIEGEEKIAGMLEQQVRKAVTNLAPAKPKPSFSEQDSTLKNYNFSATGQESFAQKKITADIRMIGQALKTYILAEDKNGLMIIDQHAAQERVRYEKYMNQYMEKKVVSQELLNPLTLELNASESVIINEHMILLNNLGFDIEEFGRNSFLLRSVPEIFGRLQGRDVFLAIVDDLKQGKSSKIDDTKEERLIRMACRSSIKAGDYLDYNGMIDVLDSLFKAKDPYTCPHGRPTMLRFNEVDFEKMFKRRL